MDYGTAGYLGACDLWDYARRSFGQQSAPLNFFASAGGCEMDFGKDGLADGWSMFHEGLAPEHTSLSLDSGIRFAGTASQRVRLQKSGGVGGRFVIHENVEFTAYLTPKRRRAATGAPCPSRGGLPKRALPCLCVYGAETGGLDFGDQPRHRWLAATVGGCSGRARCQWCAPILAAY
jgi:hypothetical protein